MSESPKPPGYPSTESVMGVCHIFFFTDYFLIVTAHSKYMPDITERNP
jgi:hypothetical protein